MRYVWRLKACGVVLEDCVENRDENLLQSVPPVCWEWSLVLAGPQNHDHAGSQRVLVGITKKHAKAYAVWVVGDQVLKLTFVPTLFSSRALESGWPKNNLGGKHIARSQWEERQLCISSSLFFLYIFPRTSLCFLFLKLSCFFWYFSVKTCSMVFFRYCLFNLSLNVWCYGSTQIN